MCIVITLQSIAAARLDQVAQRPHREWGREGHDMDDGTQKVAIVTGASRGLGRSTALHLAAQGVGIIGTYHSREDEAATVAREIEGHGVGAVMLRLDTADSASFPGFADRVTAVLRETFGRDAFHFLVNNAGFGVYAPFAETTEEQFDSLVAAQFKGTYFLSQRLLPLMADGGAILNLGTGLTATTYPGFSAYAAVKAAVDTLSRYMARELGPRGIRVNSIAPGAIETDFGGGLVRDDADANREFAAMIALGRVGLPDDIGAAAATILSDGLAWMTGQRVEVSGGQNL